ncbi:MAG TPA: LPS export ABC transporter periplasmic protein LptC [Burkholderiales bacterium]|jgi:lipopolysaccharide export system protein LptC|nr:LPS export ABC transporter periplasmic protein LptC [Burkholderiales bacterium]
MLSTTRLFPLGVMVALALLTFYLERAVREDDAPPAARRHDPDYYVVNFTTTTYNSEGTVESIMSAARMVHYPDDDTTELFAPRMVHSKPREPRYSVRAERGQLSRDGDEIFLYGDVVLVRDASPERPEARMTTEFLHVLRDRSLARTDREVKIVEGSVSLTGRGMEYNNASRELVLRSDVVARFETNGEE